MSIVLRFGEEVVKTGGLDATPRIASNFNRAYLNGPRIDIGNINDWISRVIPVGADLGEEAKAFTHVIMATQSMMLFYRTDKGSDCALAVYKSGAELVVAGGEIDEGGLGVFDLIGLICTDHGARPEFLISRVGGDGEPVHTRGDVPGEMTFTTLSEGESTAVFYECFTVCLTLQMMNCKGAKLVDHQAPRAQRRRAEREGRAGEMATWHTIDITPFGRAMSNVGHVGRDGLGVALHKCRAHFADYTKGNGLFGKHKGIFLIPEHWRGDASQGVVRGDYRLRPPQGDEKYKAPEIVSQETA